MFVLRKYSCSIDSTHLCAESWQAQNGRVVGCVNQPRAVQFLEIDIRIPVFEFVLVQWMQIGKIPDDGKIDGEINAKEAKGNKCQEQARFIWPRSEVC